jgi:RNA polymerase sigma-70 factor (ECF subfamily)
MTNLARDRAYADLYRRYSPGVFARLTRLVGPCWDREDLLQQVFLELYRALPRFRGDCAIGTFIHQIAGHVAIDHLRQRRRRCVRDVTAPEPDGLIGGELTPEERTHQRRELDRVVKLLERLEPTKRVALALVAFAELSLKETAARIDATPDLAKQRVRRARVELLALRARGERMGCVSA